MAKGGTSATRTPAARAGPGTPGRSERAEEWHVRDLQSLLARAVARLRERTRCAQVVAWALRVGGEPYVAAADFAGTPPPATPTREVFEAVAALGGPCDLRGTGVPRTLSRFADRHGLRAAVPVTADGGVAVAALLLAGGEPRPRVLAALGAAARGLAQPVRAAAAWGRLGRLDADVVRLDRLAGLGGLVAEIAHEVRNPLVSLKTFLELLPEHRDDAEFLTSFHALARDELERIERLLDLVMQQVRPARETGAPHPLPLAPALSAVVELVRPRALRRGVEVDLRVAGGPSAAIDPDELRQIALNLALNAIDATPEGGRVGILARCRPGGAAEIEVVDAGPGVPPALRPHLFEPFFSTRDDRPGGLGLAISRRLIECAGGSIEVRDAETGGASFLVRLPRGPARRWTRPALEPQTSSR